MYKKIFSLSQCKNASSSIQNAILTIKPCKCFNWKGYILVDDKKKKFNWINIWRTVEKYDYIRDDPFPFIYKELFEKYPNEKYFLTYRDSDIWFDSFLYGFKKKWNRDYKCKQILYPYPLLEKNREYFIEIYNTLNNKIIDYFKDNPNFLHFNISKLEEQTDEENWIMIYNFLNLEPDSKVITKPFPHLRKRPI